VAAAMLLTLKGTPFLYYGEEIGMTCVRIPRQRLRDPLGIRTWPFWRNGRDQERTPMQWDSSPGAGFTQGKAWLPINPDWHSRNVAAQEVEVASLLAWYRSLLKLRKATEELRCGGIAFIDVHRHILAYDRKIENGPSSDSGGIRVLLNFSAKSISVKMRRGGSVLLGTEREIGSIIEAGSIELHPYEVLIYAMIR
jgi:glycosidase